MKKLSQRDWLLINMFMLPCIGGDDSSVYVDLDDGSCDGVYIPVDSDEDAEAMVADWLDWICE